MSIDVSAEYDRYIEGLQEEAERKTKPEKTPAQKAVSTLFDFLEPFDENCATFAAELRDAIGADPAGVRNAIRDTLIDRASDTHCALCIQEGILRPLEDHRYNCDGRDQTFSECPRCEPNPERREED